MSGRRHEGVDTADVAASVHRLAVLLQAGLTPPRAWSHLARSGDETADAVSRAFQQGRPVADVLRSRGEAWAQIGIAWQVATTVGAPLAESLRGLADALRDAHQARDDVRTALAEPQTTARLISWLPLAALGLGAALGFDPLAALTQPIGVVCLVLGGALMIITSRWTAALVARAQPDHALPGLGADVVAIALSGGVSLDRAIAVSEAAAGTPTDAETLATLDLSRSAGVPAIDLLRADAAAQRQESRTAGRLRAATLSTRLLLPLGVCTLPAFLLLGVGPMLLSVLTATPLTL